MKVKVNTKIIYSTYDIVKAALLAHEDNYYSLSQTGEYPDFFNKVIRINLGRCAGHTTTSLQLLQENKKAILYNAKLPRAPFSKRIVTPRSAAIAIEFKPELVIIDPSERFIRDDIDFIIRTHSNHAKQILILG